MEQAERSRTAGLSGARAPLEPRPAAAAPDARRRPCSRDPSRWQRRTPPGTVLPVPTGGRPAPRSRVSPAGAPSPRWRDDAGPWTTRPWPPSPQRLYGLRPEEFTRARDAEVKQARADGDRAGAAAIAALRRPSLAAWLVNALMRDTAGGDRAAARPGRGPGGGPARARRRRGARPGPAAAAAARSRRPAGAGAGPRARAPGERGRRPGGRADPRRRDGRSRGRRGGAVGAAHVVHELRGARAGGGGAGRSPTTPERGAERSDGHRTRRRVHTHDHDTARRGNRKPGAEPDPERDRLEQERRAEEARRREEEARRREEERRAAELAQAREEEHEAQEALTAALETSRAAQARLDDAEHAEEDARRRDRRPAGAAASRRGGPHGCDPRRARAPSRA